MRILAVVHVYYHDMWPELAACLASLGKDLDLRVTVVRKDEELEEAIRRSFPAADIELVENRGFDVGPFFHVLNRVDLGDYDVVVKLHTKRDVHRKYMFRGVCIEGSGFRDLLLAFCHTPENWRKSSDILNQRGIGMVGAGSLILSPFADTVPNRKEIRELFEKFGLRFKGGYFVAGTMFAVRAELLRVFQYRFSLKDFDVPDREKRDGLPHYLERFLGYAVYAQGYAIRSWDGVPFESQVFFSRIRTLLFHKYYGRRRIIWKILGIPVWYRRWER